LTSPPAEGPALLGHAFDVAAKLDLFGQQRFNGPAIFGALVGKANATGAGELGGGFQVELLRGFGLELAMA